jgi:hypothetical protein
VTPPSGTLGVTVVTLFWHSTHDNTPLPLPSLLLPFLLPPAAGADVGSGLEVEVQSDGRDFVG